MEKYIEGVTNCKASVAWIVKQEQIEDIVRRSCVNAKKTSETQDNVDDLFLKLFSRKNTGRPRK